MDADKLEDDSDTNTADTEKNEARYYKKNQGFSGLRGEAFEYKMCALLFSRASRLNLKFSMASSLEGCGAFDDIVLQCSFENKKETFFLQLKNKKRAIITLSSLLAQKNDFSLQKYYNSYIEVAGKLTSTKESSPFNGELQNCIFVIFTNADVETRLKNKQEVIKESEDILMTGGHVLRLNQEEHKEIFDGLKHLPNYVDFLSRLVIMYQQANEHDLDQKIMTEIQKKLKLEDDELGLASSTFRENIQDWWQNSNVFLSESWTNQNPLKKTLEYVRGTLATKYLNERKDELSKQNVLFNESAMNDIEETINTARVTVLVSASSNTTISASKLHQILNRRIKYVILKLEGIVEHHSDVLIAWKNNQFDTLIIELDSAAEHLQDLCLKIHNTLCNFSINKKIVFVTKCNDTSSVQTVTNIFPDAKTIRDTIRFDDFHQDTQNRLLENNIIFQGIEIVLRSLIDELDSQWLDTLKPDTISQLLGNKKLTISTPLQKTIDFYMSRSLKSKIRIVNNDILKEKNIVFAISGEEDTLRRLLPLGERMCLFENWEEDSTTRFVHIQNTQEYESICEKKSCVLWLERDYNKFIWKNSSTDIETIKPYLYEDKTVDWRPNSLLDTDDRIVIITADPGMGKSTLLTHLANETKKKCPHMWIVRININDFTARLNEMRSKSFREENALELLSSAAGLLEVGCSTLEKELFSYHCNISGNMIVLLDGVDEVYPYYYEEVVNVLRALLKTKIRKFWITSRPLLKKKLEKQFQKLSNTITYFSKDDKKCFLVKFWKAKKKSFQSKELESFADRVLEAMEKNLADKDQAFIGIPLHAMLLAEVFEKVLTCQNAEIPSLLGSLNIVSLCDKYIEKKWYIYLKEKKLDLTNVSFISYQEELYKKFLDQNMVAALVALVPIKRIQKLSDRNIESKAQDYLVSVCAGLEKTELIIGVKEGKPQFIHQTFAEYFVAKWFAQNLNVNKGFLKKYLLKPGFETIRLILDRLLTDTCPLHTTIIDGQLNKNMELIWSQNLINDKDKGGRTALHLAVIFDFPDEVRILLKHGANINTKDDILSWTPVKYADELERLEVMAEIMDHKLDWNILSRRGEYKRISAARGLLNLLNYYIKQKASVKMVDGTTVLHIAARHGQLEVMDRVLALGLNVDIPNIDSRTPLHCAAEWGQMEAVMFLLSRNAQIEARDFNNWTPLHLALFKKHIEIAELLISKGTTLEVIKKKVFTPLHMAAIFGQNDIVKLLLETGFSSNVCDEFGRTPLHGACMSGHYETIKLLLEAHSNINAIDNNGYSPLYYSITGGYPDILKFLMYSDAEMKIFGKEGLSAMHVEASYKNTEVMKYILDTSLPRKCDESQTLINGFTPLHLACRTEIAELLIEKGADVNRTSRYVETPLGIACKEGRIQLTELLIKKGANVNKAYLLEETPLHTACKEGSIQVIELLIENGANVNKTDFLEETPLGIACKEGRIQVIELLIENGADVNKTSCYGETPLHIACEQGRIQVIKLLIEKGADVNKTSRCGETPLHTACKEGSIQVIELLIENGADVNAVDQLGFSPLCSALFKLDSAKKSKYVLRNPQVRLLELLIDNGADVNIKVNKLEGRSLIDLLTLKGNRGLTKLLQLADHKGNKLQIVRHTDIQ